MLVPAGILLDGFRVQLLSDETQDPVVLWSPRSLALFALEIVFLLREWGEAMLWLDPHPLLSVLRTDCLEDVV